ncbi:tyrosine-type recombinase/integrase [soil metagenome]
MPNLRIILENVRRIEFPTGTAVFYWDDKDRGFGVKANPSGLNFIAESRVNGKTRRVKIGNFPTMTPDEARRRAKVHLAAFSAGTDVTAEKRKRRAKGVILAEVYERFKKDRQFRPKTIEVYDGLIQRCFKDWLTKPLDEITKDMCAQKFDDLLSLKGPRTTDGKAQADQAMRSFRAIYNYASALYEDPDGKPLLPENPVKRLSQAQLWKKSKTQPRDNVIKPTQLKAWVEAVMSLENTSARDFLLLCLFTGLRRNEATGLKWSEIDFQDKTLTIPAARIKTNKDLTLPLSTFVFDLLHQRSEMPNIDENPYVFPGKKEGSHMGEPKALLNKVRDQSKVSFIIHDLRRTFATTAERLDISYYKLKNLLNHSVSSDVTGGHYVQIDVEQLREPMQKIADFFVVSGAIKRPDRQTTKS